MTRVRISVPATSANIGPGFDALGLALSLYAHFQFEISDGGVAVNGCPPQYQNEDNLTVTAFQAVYKQLGLPMPGLTVNINSQIPITRGLGSSSALLTAGALAANALNGSPLSKEALLMILTELEGHPDNVTPALFGGLTASAIFENKPICVKYDVHPGVRFCAMIPNFELSTVSSRMALPTTVTHGDAVFNVSRVALLLKGMETNDKAALAAALHDRLHQPYREHLIDEYKTVRMIALTAGAYGVYLSGAGPTLMCVYSDPSVPETIARYTRDLRNVWRVEPLVVDPVGARVLEG